MFVELPLEIHDKGNQKENLFPLVLDVSEEELSCTEEVLDAEFMRIF